MQGGGDETRNAQAFRTLSFVPRSCTNLTPTRATASGSALLAFFMATKAITYLQAEGDVEACVLRRTQRAVARSAQPFPRGRGTALCHSGIHCRCIAG